MAYRPVATQWRDGPPTDGRWPKNSKLFEIKASIYKPSWDSIPSQPLTNPIGMEGALTVGSLVRMRAKIVALGLQ
jgi:hypothetical protein